ncbi:hypothetical protein BV898_18131 [Hypsibius exemplaris]|uniref:Uncharacterized protein n=1 Tax=Hypsibius exemplaris TaxID=2072580 RepID=A0A9X6NPV6_HYPEX|nr:hypothetical protein BV898_18131 [Hypsibius exemplaris]
MKAICQYHPFTWEDFFLLFRNSGSDSPILDKIAKSCGKSFRVTVQPVCVASDGHHHKLHFQLRGQEAANLAKAWAYILAETSSFIQKSPALPQPILFSIHGVPHRLSHAYGVEKYRKVVRAVRRLPGVSALIGMPQFQQETGESEAVPTWMEAYILYGLDRETLNATAPKLQLCQELVNVPDNLWEEFVRNDGRLLADILETTGAAITTDRCAGTEGPSWTRYERWSSFCGLAPEVQAAVDRCAQEVARLQGLKK